MELIAVTILRAIYDPLLLRLPLYLAVMDVDYVTLICCCTFRLYALLIRYPGYDLVTVLPLVAVDYVYGYAHVCYG